MFMGGCVLMGMYVHGYTYVCVHGCVCSSVCVCARTRMGVHSLSSSCGNQKTIPGTGLPLPPLRQALLFTAAYPSLDFHLTHHHENPGMTDMHYCTQHYMGSGDLKSGLSFYKFFTR